jgi:iron transport multicopper oxidase
MVSLEKKKRSCAEDAANAIECSLSSPYILFSLDGAAQTTQCPIPAGQSISYEPLNSPNSPSDRQQQWGTFWTHGHYDGQYVDGLRTPSIIHAENEPHAYDDDFTIILADWYHREHGDLLVNEFLNIKNPTGAEPVPGECPFNAV